MTNFQTNPRKPNPNLGLPVKPPIHIQTKYFEADLGCVIADDNLHHVDVASDDNNNNNNNSDDETNIINLW